MATLDKALMQMTVGYDDLLRVAEIHAGTAKADTATQAMRESGIVSGTRVDPVAAALTEVAVAPARSIVVERFDGAAIAPLFIGWLPDGRATISEADAAGDVVVRATEMSLLPGLLRQWLGLLDRELPAHRTVLRTDTAVIDAAMGDRGNEPSGDDALDAVIEGWRVSWRAVGSWAIPAGVDAAAERVDASFTVVDAGHQGWWRVDHPQRLGDEVVDVTLVPLTLAEVMEALGDVITGRGSRDDDVNEAGKEPS